MPPNIQTAKLTSLINYYDHCVKLATEGYSLHDNKKSLRCFSFLNGLSFPLEDEIFSLLGSNVFVEIYDLNFMQIYRSPNWLETVSYGLKTLETQDWRNLFARSDEILAKQMEIVQGLYSGIIKKPVHRPIKIHTVKELRHKQPYCCELESLLYSPVYDGAGNFIGGLHLLKLHNLRKLEFQVLSDSSV